MNGTTPTPSNLGPFVLGDTLGTNGMVITRAGVHQADGLEAVVAMVETGEVEPEIRARVIKESEEVSQKDFKYVLPPFQWGEEKGWLWCAWKRLTGDHAGRLMRTSGIPPLYVTLELGRQIVLGLQEIESMGLTHGALSPASVFIDNEANVQLLHVPWGRLIEGVQDKYLHPAWMSVLPFTAPEVASEGKPSAHGDAYSLGAFLYFLVLGRPAHWADDPAALLEAIQKEPLDLQPLADGSPVPVVELVEELLSLDPEDRPVNWPALEQRIAACTEMADQMPEKEAAPDGEAASEAESADTASSMNEADTVAPGMEPPPGAAAVAPAAPAPSGPDDTHPAGEGESEIVDPRFAGTEDLSPHSESEEEEKPVGAADLPGAAASYRNRISGTAEAEPVEGNAPSLPTPSIPVAPHAPQPRLSARDEFGTDTSESGMPTMEDLPAEEPEDGSARGASASTSTQRFGSATEVSSTGASPRTLTIFALGLAILLLAGGSAYFILRGSGSDAEDTAQATARSQSAARAKVPKDPQYTTTANTILVLGRFVQLYQKAYHKYPTSFSEMGQAKDSTIDAWGTPLDLRDGFVVSAGKDKKWDTKDDLYFDPETSLIGGDVGPVDLPDEVLGEAPASQPAGSGT